MPYRYLEDVAISDAAFEAWGDTAEEVFLASADATMNVMIEDINTIADLERRTIVTEDDTIDMLLFQLLQELIFFKDAEQLLLRLTRVEIQQGKGHYSLKADAYGERLDPARHSQRVDVKAVTLHRFRVEQTARHWEAFIILDT